MLKKAFITNSEFSSQKKASNFNVDTSFRYQTQGIMIMQGLFYRQRLFELKGGFETSKFLSRIAVEDGAKLACQICWNLYVFLGRIRVNPSVHGIAADSTQIWFFCGALCIPH